MMRLLLSVGLLGTALIQPIPSGAGGQRDEPPAVVTDMPDIIDMSYASPDAWHALPPPIPFHEKPPLPALEPNEVELPSSRTKLALNQGWPNAITAEFPTSELSLPR